MTAIRADGDAGTPAVFGRNEQGAALWGEAPNGGAVSGFSGTWIGVYGKSEKAAGVVGESQEGDGIQGNAHHAERAGVVASNDAGGYAFAALKKGPAGQHPAAYVHADDGHASWSEAPNGTAVSGFSDGWMGVYGRTASTNGGCGVKGEHSGGGSGVYGVSAAGVGVWGKGGHLAGRFEGDVEVTGDIRLPNADFAEDFDVHAADEALPGTVMVLGADGAVRPSERAYDRCVAGIVSGAGDYKPGIILDRRAAAGARLPVALVGKAYCRVDAVHGEVAIGDLLTTSPTPGHAMKASDPARAFGAVIGKALAPLVSGRGLVPVLVALQ